MVNIVERSGVSVEGYDFVKKVDADTDTTLCVRFTLLRRRRYRRYLLRDMTKTPWIRMHFDGVSAVHEAERDIVEDYKRAQGEPSEEEPQSVRTISGGLPSLGKKRR